MPARILPAPFAGTEDIPVTGQLLFGPQKVKSCAWTLPITYGSASNSLFCRRLS